MKLGMLFGLSLAGLGGAAYAHKRRGGTWSKDSIMDSLNLAKSRIQDVISKSAPQRPVASPSSVKDRFGYSEYTVSKADRPVH